MGRKRCEKTYKKLCEDVSECLPLLGESEGSSMEKATFELGEHELRWK
jgi:hypothetical protein